MKASVIWPFFALLPLAAQPALDNLMPRPATVIPADGRLPINQNFRIAFSGYDEPRLREAADRLVRRIAAKTGIPIPGNPENAGSPLTLTLHCERAGAAVQQPVEDESYRLEVTASGASLAAPGPLGILRGLETFFQLVDLDASGFHVPAVRIDDRPRFPWRGLMIDVARHFQPLPVLRRNIEAMAAMKLNVLHLHLSDDQGFRIESRRFPALHERGSDGHYYTQEQMRELVAFARGRGIRVIPEFDMPGHTAAWLPGEPGIASGPPPYRIERTWGVHQAALNPAAERTYEVIDGLVGEMAAIFPDPYFHIGGDEVIGHQWDASASIQRFMKEKGLADNHALQAWFNRRVLAIVQKHGKIMMGWDEVLHPDLPKDVVIQSWRGTKALAEAAQRGHRVVLSNGYYLDLMRPASAHYAVDPLAGEAAQLAAEQQALVLGGEACIWSEYVTPEIFDQRVWPRMAAIAERFWSPANTTDVASMYRRLAPVSRELEWYGLTHRRVFRPMLERIAGSTETGALLELALIVEPTKEYTRSTSNRYYQDTPHNRLVDAVPPESDAGREFRTLADRAAGAGAAAKAARDEVRSQLERWRTHPDRVRPAAARSALMTELMPVSEGLAAIASAGLEALDLLDGGKPASAAWVKQKLDVVRGATLRPLPEATRRFCIEILMRHAQSAASAEKNCARPRPAAELLISIQPGVERLIEAGGA